MRERCVLIFLGGLALVAGCSDDPRGSAPPGPVLVTQSGIEGSAILVKVDRPIDAASLREGKALVAFVDTDEDPGGVFVPLPGEVSLPGPRTLRFRPSAPTGLREVRLVLTDRLHATDGGALAGGQDSAAISFRGRLPRAVYEQRSTLPSGGATLAATASGGPDDHGDDAASATALSIGGDLDGVVDVSGDSDWFRVDLRAGAAYTFRTETQGDTTLALFSGDGRLLAENDDAPGGGLHSRLEHTATTDGAHTLRVRGFADRTPTYRLFAEGPAGGGPPPPPPGDDHGDSAQAATTLRLDRSLAGEIELSGDADWFAFDLSQGAEATITTRTSGDTVLAVFESDGTTLLAQNDDDPAGGRGSRVQLSAPHAGVFYARVTGYSSTTPRYDVLAQERSQGLSDPSRFQIKNGTDPWHLDFVVTAGAFTQDLDGHGLRSGDAPTDRLARDLVLETVLAFVSEKYQRTPDGEPVPGLSWAISFTAEDPPGSPGRSYSRMAIGGAANGAGILGVAYYDAGNRRFEDNARRGELGVFAADIDGRDSFLRPALLSGDRPYLDGTYRLGAGTSSQDRRFQQVRRVIADWAHALAVVTAHEVGHSVGLDHYSADPRGIMQPALSRWVLSDRSTDMSATSANVLDRNLGHD